ncbi:tetratricopeptide repeat protein 31 [Pelobates fuscus]|uniref:tetratricopeptide repeat protein 31 n=1 Tax=Pelobates fuscus TaxID=191477 RepID=UPI002FE4C5BD
MDSDDDSFADEYYYYNRCDGYDDDDEEEDRSFDDSSSLQTFLRLRSSLLCPNQLSYKWPVPTPITQEEADRNAEELLEQEKKEKEKVNKKRLKKKRQKDRKRQQKLDASKDKNKCFVKDEMPDANFTSMASNTGSADVESVKESLHQTDRDMPDDNQRYVASKTESVDLESVKENLSKSDTEDDLDLQSTFVQKAKKKVENKPKSEKNDKDNEWSRNRVLERSQERIPKKAVPTSKANIADQYQIQQSMDLANIGNNMAQREHFIEAVRYYTEALTLNPTDCRFLGNRSYSYERCGKYNESLLDAEQALFLQPHFIKGYFRKGKALKGLQRYAEAIAAFQKVLASDVNHTEAATEILQCQLEMQASTNRVNVPNSSPLSPPLIPPEAADGARYLVYKRSDVNIPIMKPKPSVSSKMLPTMSKLYPVWVGNVTNKITENILRGKFEQFGPIHSMRILYSRTCAFINFTAKQDAERAFRALQGLNVEDTTFVLQLRNPEHSDLNVSKIGTTQPVK